MRYSVPTSIRDKIAGKTFETDRVGMSDSQVLCFEDMALKMEPCREESEHEYKMLEWLQGKLPVPRILDRQVENGVSYLLMERADGEMACSETYLKDPGRLVSCLAGALKLLWSVDVGGCPYGRQTDFKLELAGERVKRGLCSMEDVEPDTYGENGFKNPGHLLAWLRENKPREEKVFTHGDFCLPNIFLKNGGVSGFIDWGRGGAADAYQDIALCYRSLIHNFDGSFNGKKDERFDAKLLFHELQIEPDWNKIRYYVLLDELF